MLSPCRWAEVDGIPVVGQAIVVPSAEGGAAAGEGAHATGGGYGFLPQQHGDVPWDAYIRELHESGTNKKSDEICLLLRSLCQESCDSLWSRPRYIDQSAGISTNSCRPGCRCCRQDCRFVVVGCPMTSVLRRITSYWHVTTTRK